MAKKRKAPPTASVPEDSEQDEDEEVEEKPQKKSKKGKTNGAIVSADGAEKAKPEKPQALFSREEKKALEKEAIADILAGISKPEMQNSNKAYIIRDWPSKYKMALGSYKSFVKGHSRKFTLIEHDACNFTIRKAGTPEAAKGVAEGGQTSAQWHKQLLKAWMNYCLATPKAKRNFKDFTAEIPKGSPASPALKPASSPALTPAGSPKLQPSGEGGGAKKKKNKKPKDA